MRARVTRTVAVAGGLLLASVLGARPALAHRLDEYLQATTILVARDRVAAQLRLTPGVAVFRRVFAGIDADGDGIASPAEQRAYADRVVRDLSLTLDGVPRPLRLVAVTFPDVAALQAGRGEIVLDVDAVVPSEGGDRRLTFENRHQRPIGVYLVNALVPRDTTLRIGAQRRTVDQSWYALDYGVADPQAGLLVRVLPPTAWPWLAIAALALIGWLMLLRAPRADGAAAPRSAAARSRP